MKNVILLFASLNILFEDTSIWNIYLYFLSILLPILKSPFIQKKNRQYQIRYPDSLFWCVLHFITFSSCAINRMNEMWDQNSFFSTFICVGKMMPCYNCKFTGQQSIIGNFICRYEKYLYKWFKMSVCPFGHVIILVNIDIIYLTWCNESTQWKPNIQKHNYNFSFILSFL